MQAVRSGLMLKRKHWSGFQPVFAREGSWMLEFRLDHRNMCTLSIPPTAPTFVA
jgi:hypothetical protein